MTYPIRIHYQKTGGMADPHVWIRYGGSTHVKEQDIPAARDDHFGPYFDFTAHRLQFFFKFKSGPGTNGPWEPANLERRFEGRNYCGSSRSPIEIWTRGDKAFIYDVEPRQPETLSATEFIKALPWQPGVYCPSTGAQVGLGAHCLQDGRLLFGLYHPNAARVYVTGSFNNWQNLQALQQDPDQVFALKLYTGYFNIPNIWLLVTDQASVGDEYQFYVQGGVPKDHKNRCQRKIIDPYARQLGKDFNWNNAVIVNPTTYTWHDQDWQTPDPNQLIFYEMSIYGFTEEDQDISPENRGQFAGITERIENGYFQDLGITALSLMPLAEVPSMQGPHSLGYDPSLFMTVERDFGTPDDLRRLVDCAHQHGLAILLDQVFNHTSNDFNPLWQLILEHPDEQYQPGEGGLYFSGATQWGNRIATEKTDVQNMLIDACKLFLVEYHVDGFRFDATHTHFMDHGFLHYLADELKALKPDVILVAENLPNQPDLNRHGYDGFAQWNDHFHDKIKAMLREGSFEGSHYDTDGLADIFYFSKSGFADHTHNVVNYCESHDEHSVAYETGTNPQTNHPATKVRKSRLGLFATMVALGQPMIYMGQEFYCERERNLITVKWPDDLENHGYYQWVRRLIQLRQRYPGLKLYGYNPVETGQFCWIAGYWLPVNFGGGHKVLGWRSRPNEFAHDALVILLNFEYFDVTIDVNFGIPGIWVKLADIDTVNDIPPNGTNSKLDATAIHTYNGLFGNFILPGSSGFIYKWETVI